MVKINAKHVNPFVEAAMKVVTQQIVYNFDEKLARRLVDEMLEISIAVEETETIQEVAVSSYALLSGA